MTQRLDVLVHPASLVVEDCCRCGMFFAMTRDFQERRRFDGEMFYCPAGHPQHYTVPEKQRLERELAAAKARAESAQERADYWLERADAQTRSLRATRGVLTRTKRRIAAGICPCCKRHFENLNQHMSNKHPRYATEDHR